MYAIHSNQFSDGVTKGVSNPTFKTLIGKLGITISIPQLEEECQKRK